MANNYSGVLGKLMGVSRVSNFGNGGSNYGALETMDIWLAINGNNVSNSNTQVVGNSNNGRAVAAWNFVEPMNAGDYFELKFRVSDTRLGFAYDVAAINPTRPAIPSVIVTVTQV